LRTLGENTGWKQIPSSNLRWHSPVDLWYASNWLRSMQNLILHRSVYFSRGIVYHRCARWVKILGENLVSPINRGWYLPRRLWWISDWLWWMQNSILHRMVYFPREIVYHICGR
jgi:hypothetical protein